MCVLWRGQKRGGEEGKGERGEERGEEDREEEERGEETLCPKENKRIAYFNTLSYGNKRRRKEVKALENGGHRENPNSHPHGTLAQSTITQQ